MDVGLRIMNRIEITTSLTLVNFLSKKLDSIMSTLEIALASALILIFTYLIGKEYVLSPLSRRLAILLILERIRPWITEMTSKENLMQLQGLMVSTGFLCCIAIVPNTLKQIQEVQTLIQSFVYMYSNIFDFIIIDKNNHILVLCISSLSLGWLSLVEKGSHVYNTFTNVLSIVATSLSLSIIQMSIQTDLETSILQLLMIFTILHYFHFNQLQNVEDYIIYNIAMFARNFITQDEWLYSFILFIIMQGLLYWISLKSQFVQILILIIVNTVVGLILDYIQKLAVYDTLITLKTSALVLQFVVHFFSKKFLAQSSE